MYEPDSRLDPNVTFLWRVSRTIRFAVFGIPFAIVLFTGLSFFFQNWILAVILTGFFVSYQLLLAWVWPSLEYRYFRYAIREHDLLVQQGVLFRRLSSIPLHRIQHVDTRQGPLERLVGIARLQLYTAAGMNADGSIPGLAEEDAERLRDELSKRGGDDGV